MSIREIALSGYSLPLRHPWPSAEGPRGTREGLILFLIEEDGTVGHGEAAPWPGFGMETLPSAQTALSRAAKHLIGLMPDSYLDAAAQLSRLAPVAASPAARCAIDLALHDLAARRAGVSIARLLGGDRALRHVRANATIPRLSADETARAGRGAVADGALTLKLKIGGAPIGEDAARLRALRDAVGPGIRIRVDANGAWTEAEAIEALAALRGFDLEYAEQPIAAENIEGLARVRAAVAPLRIAADEAVADASAARRILALGAADILVVKPMALGGLRAALAVAALARDGGIPVVVTSLLDSAVGRTGALHLAAALGPTPYAHGVATGPALARDLTASPMTPAAAPPGSLSPGVVAPFDTLPVPEGPGLGVTTDPALRAGATLLASTRAEEIA